ncbi:MULTISPECIES: YjjG family noncanonical pyrimidine nucleotidase [unclassified Spirosoma]|uniref:YjjG family noncanonical pyrimidine nucleotidase n=1 Tax=unclassified Spirosoma TaxID=2621999 RepID=UPI00096250DE|nr:MULTISPECIES: YjjG family noncanonical pyrimidine nucleotidase [unclassified Spirosoma]MBN8822277.1 YjjG family noncanonical pyrimidine nucleotidase [Spirosoma sp.]OJW72417.1 MAG: noncanonical pyrimidine nucleotidase, YjjG family [Spirosoma sp. 48-14]
MYKHLFFDLDHTLWDFDRNSAECITELFDTFRLADLGIESAAEFSRHFIAVNRKLWADYDKNLIEHSYIRQHRFPMVFRALGVDESAVQADLNAEYLKLLPYKPHLLESARDILDYLHGRYVMHIITNGFAEIQAIKMNSSDIAHYFVNVITSEKANAKKPDPRVFEYAMAISGTTAAESLMIGDNYEADILGAKSVGIDTLFYNPAGISVADKPTYEICHWNELRAIL